MPQPAPEASDTAPLRVLHVHNSADIYGASRSLLRLLTAIDRRRFQPLVVLPETGVLKEKLEAAGVEVLVQPGLSIITRPVFKSWRILLFMLQFPVSAYRLRRLIRQRGVELVHTNTGVVVSSALAARLAGVPHVWHIRDWFQEFGAVWPIYSRYIVGGSKKVVCVSNAIAGQFPPGEKLTVIHNGFSLDEFRVPAESLRAEFRARHGLGEGFVVGCVGRIKLVRKGQEELVRAMGMLKRRGRELRAVIVGAPFPGNEPHLEELHRLARELDVADRIVFTGEMPDPRPAYAAMDVLAMTSAQPEPFGGVVMEAMSMGVPVIATNIGGSLDQVAEGETGLFVPPADAKALAAAIEQLMDDAPLRSRMGRAAVRRIETKFSLSEMVRRLEDLFTNAARR
ncbi:MAG TPA: glycosyltransferase [Verrucomicrobiota bacterium]|nr:glycosyltransferase [Verrucomicrobiota bacterium]